VAACLALGQQRAATEQGQRAAAHQGRGQRHAQRPAQRAARQAAARKLLQQRQQLLARLPQRQAQQQQLGQGHQKRLPGVRAPPVQPGRQRGQLQVLASAACPAAAALAAGTQARTGPAQAERRQQRAERQGGVCRRQQQQRRLHDAQRQQHGGRGRSQWRVGALGGQPRDVQGAEAGRCGADEDVPGKPPGGQVALHVQGL
jgi:hypothetical protein